MRWCLVVVVGCVLLGGCRSASVAVAVRAPDPAVAALPEPAEPVAEVRPEPAPDPLAPFFSAFPAALLAPPDTSGARAWVAATLAAMEPSARQAQLVVAGIPAGSPWSAVRAPMLALARRGVGGFLVPRAWAPDEVARATAELQAAAPVPLLIAADYERGAGRIDEAGRVQLTELPAAMAFGAAGDTLLAAAAGRLVAIESRAVGVNLLFGPVVDVNRNPANPIINTRAYSERADDVLRLARAFVREAEGHGLLTTLKHFPGHGDTATDSHSRLATVSATRGTLDASDLAPYRALLAPDLAGGGAPSAVMAAHVWAPALDPARRPATLSAPVLTGLLRRQIGFEGLIVTDDVQMGALDGLSDGERAVAPLIAGADLALTPRSTPVALAALADAVAAGRLTDADVDARARRVLRAKARAGLHRATLPVLGTLDALGRTGLGAPLADRVARAGATLLKTLPGALPVRGRVLLVQVSNVRAAGTLASAMDGLRAALAPASERRFDGALTPADRAALRASAAGADVVVLALHLRLVSGRGSAGLRVGQAGVLGALKAAGVPVVVVGFGSPYELGAFAGADAVLALYDSTLPSVRAAAAVLRGERGATGRLPVTAGPFPYGSHHR